MKEENIAVKNACSCGIYQSPADKIKNGMYVCQANSCHIGDGVVGIFTDCSFNLEADSNEN